MEKTKFCSIIITHYRGSDERSSHNGEERSEAMMLSIASLVETTKNYPCEIIVVDNGQDKNDSRFLLDMAERGNINTYIRNAKNMVFGWARNQGIKISNGEYICIADNDIYYKPGWIEECIKILEAFPNEKIYATCLDYPMSGLKVKYWAGELELDGKTYKKSMRAGSNCFVIRKKDLEEIGLFSNHIVAGSKWTDRAVRAGYTAAVVPGNLVEDKGFRKGYNFNELRPISLVLSNDQEIFYNVDGYKPK